MKLVGSLSGERLGHTALAKIEDLRRRLTERFVTTESDITALQSDVSTLDTDLTAVEADLAERPYGVVGYATGSTSDQTGVSTEADITGLSVTFTATAGRRYMVQMMMTVTQVTSSATVTGRITDGSNSLQSAAQITLAAGATGPLPVLAVLSGLSGSTTLKGRINTSAGTVTIEGSSTILPRLLVTDIGLA